MRKTELSLCSLAVAVFLGSSAIATELTEQDAINHLLKFVETSQCTFTRNGVEYDSKSAVSHIENKYNYFKNKIHTAEDFIALAAAKSELSGRPYLVRCGQGKRISSADWLREELEAYRKAIKEEK